MQTSETGNFEMDKHQPGGQRPEINGSGWTKFTSKPSFGLARAARVVLMAMLLFTAICAFRFPAGTQAADMVWKPLTDAYVSDRGTYYNQLIADNGTLYYAFRDDDLYASDRLTNKVVVKKYDGQQWTDTGPIATGNVDSIRLALDPSDHVLYVAFVQNWVAKVFKLTNGGWESLGSVKSNTAAISLAVNNGVPYVTFEDGGNSSKLTVMKYNNGNQTWGPVGTPNYFNYKRATNTMPRIEVSGHIVYVAYKQNTSSTVIDLSVMMFDEDQPANGWQQVGSLLPSTADSGLLYHDFYVFDGTPYVAYQDRGNSKKLRVVKYVNTNWESVGPDQGIVSVGKADYASLAKDNNGLYLAYQDGTNDNKLMVKQYNGNAWMPVGDAAIQRKEVYYTSLSADNGKLYVAYQDDDTLLSNPVANARAFVITYGTPLSVALSNIPVPFGTVKSNALPSTIPMTWSDDTTDPAAVTWDQGTPEYDPRTPGTYSFKGQLTIPNGKHNKGEREATVNVIVGDPSHDAALAGLSASKGTLQPVFAAQTKDYNVSVANDVTEISLTATLNDTKGSLTIGGNLAASGVPSPPIALQVGPNVIHVMATAEDGVIVNDYAITVTRAGSSNAELTGLTTSAGALTPVFDSGTTAYSQSVANSVYSLRVTASLNEPNATLTIGGVPAASGVPSAEIPLQVGPNLIAVEVTAQNGTSRGHYTLTVTRAASSNAELSSLATSAGQLTPAFARGTTAYAQTVANSVYSVSVTASVYEPNATMKIDGVPAANGVSSAAIPLQVGPNAIAVDVTAQDGTTGRYTITVTRALSGNAELSSLATSAGQLTPVFSRGTTAYTQTVANSVYSVSVTASVYEPNATMKIDGVPAANDVSSAAIPLQVGPNVIAVDVTAQDGTTSRYTITVTRAASSNTELSSLATSAGQLTPVFSRGTTSYETVVASGTQTVTVTASVYDPTASLFINDAAVASGAASSEILLQDGLNPIRVKVLAQDGVTETIYTLYVTRLSDESSSESGAVSGGSVNTGAGTARTQDIIVDGVRQSSWAAFTAEQVNGKTVVTITLDEQKVLDQLANGMGQVISIPVTVEADTMIGQLTGQLVKQMADKEAVIEIGSERAIYTLPATRLDIRHIADSLEAGMNLQDITFSIRISEASQEKADLISNAAREKGLTMAALPIEFEIEAAYGNNKMVVTEFTSYVERAIGLPDNVDASQVTTGVVFTADGNLSPIPTRIDVRDGHKYAVLSSLTNSTYAAVQSSKAFADLSGHWSKNDVNEMASRLIVNGMSEDAFAPDHSVTRAEFAAMTVRALGLRSGVGTQRAYRDVAATDWFADSVSLASAFGLIGGYEDGMFRPNQSITRSEAAVILTRAADVAKLNKELPANKADGQLSGFNDAADIADWAKASVALLVNKGILQGDEQQHIAPQAAVTRAQAAVMLKRLLQQAGLID